MSRLLDTTVSADGNTDIAWHINRVDSPPRATLYVFGGGGNNFGSGTVTLQASPDDGTTFIDVPDVAGTAVAFTANGMTNFELYSSRNIKTGEVTQLRLALAGSTAPTIRYIIDNGS